MAFAGLGAAMDPVVDGGGVLAVLTQIAVPVGRTTRKLHLRNARYVHHDATARTLHPRARSLSNQSIFNQYSTVLISK